MNSDGELIDGRFVAKNYNERTGNTNKNDSSSALTNNKGSQSSSEKINAENYLVAASKSALMLPLASTRYSKI